MNNFFNTLRLSGKKLNEADTKAEACSQLILKVFKEYSRYPLTPFDVQKTIKRIYGKDFPITSIRARMTTLTDKKLLVKSEKAEAKGIYKFPNHVWQLAS